MWHEYFGYTGSEKAELSRSNETKIEHAIGVGLHSFQRHLLRCGEVPTQFDDRLLERRSRLVGDPTGQARLFLEDQVRLNPLDFFAEMWIWRSDLYDLGARTAGEYKRKHHNG